MSGLRKRLPSVSSRRMPAEIHKIKAIDLFAGVGGSMALHESTPILRRKLLHSVVDALVHNVFLLDPTFFLCRAADTKPALVLAALQHFERVPILHVPDLVVDVGDAVAQSDLLRGYVDLFFGSRVALTAGPDRQS